MSLIEKALAKSTGLSGIDAENLNEKFELVLLNNDWFLKDPKNSISNEKFRNTKTKKFRLAQVIPLGIGCFGLMLATTVFLARSEGKLFAKSDEALSKDPRSISEQMNLDTKSLASKDHGEAEGFKLTGIISFGNSSKAIINDGLFRTGDSVVEGVIVKEIQKRTVLIEHKGRELALYI